MNNFLYKSIGMPHPVFANLISEQNIASVKRNVNVTSVPEVVSANPSVKPDVLFAISQYIPLAGAITHFDIVGHHSRTQPLSLFLSDGAILIAYFDANGKLFQDFTIHEPTRPIPQSEPVTIDAYQRLHLQHIPRPIKAMQVVDSLMRNGVDFGDYLNSIKYGM